MINRQVIIARICEKQDRAAEMREELVRSLKAQEVMSNLLVKGSFSLSVTGRQTPAARSMGKRNLPYKAYIIYSKSKVKVNLSYNEWAVLSRHYFSPDEHKGIERYWNTEGT